MGDSFSDRHVAARHRDEPKAPRKIRNPKSEIRNGTEPRDLGCYVEGIRPPGENRSLRPCPTGLGFYVAAPAGVAARRSRGPVACPQRRRKRPQPSAAHLVWIDSHRRRGSVCARKTRREI